MNENTLFRRSFMAYFAGTGLAATVFPGALWAKFQEASERKITEEMVRCAEGLAGLEFTDQERQLLLEDVNENLESFEALRSLEIPNHVSPALDFDPVLPGMDFDREERSPSWNQPQIEDLPADLDQVAFWPVTHLAELLRRRLVTSVDLTQMYLNRLKKYGPGLECTVTLTEERAMNQARRADQEIAAGEYRGPLHGIPWGAKDLLAVRGYPTTWGARPFEDQTFDLDATVVNRLDEAGAVLVAKLTLGALAWGDVWFGGKTKNPWNLEQGSSGSSAGSAAATAAGLVGFAIGTETLGSIVSPCTRCGTTGLRPTFGRVSRFGAMALSWSMDKIGPICRTVEDCAMVFEAIHGPDGRDRTLKELPFNWDPAIDLQKLRIGYYQKGFEGESRNEQQRQFDLRTLGVMTRMGLKLKPIDLPDFPMDGLSFILDCEAAAAFDELTRSNRDDLLVRQVRRAWPNVFRKSRLIPAVEYIQANRLRRMLMEAMAKIMEDVDVYLTPSYAGSNLLITNLTGHPCLVLPNGFTDEGAPTSFSFIGGLYKEAETLAVARAYQQATDFHLKHPPAFTAGSQGAGG